MSSNKPSINSSYWNFIIRAVAFDSKEEVKGKNPLAKAFGLLRKVPKLLFI